MSQNQRSPEGESKLAKSFAIYKVCRSKHLHTCAKVRSELQMAPSLTGGWEKTSPQTLPNFGSLVLESFLPFLKSQYIHSALCQSELLRPSLFNYSFKVLLQSGDSCYVHLQLSGPSFHKRKGPSTLPQLLQDRAVRWVLEALQGILPSFLRIQGIFLSKCGSLISRSHSPLYSFFY